LPKPGLYIRAEPVILLKLASAMNRIS